jgi:WD40 repeat protein
MGLTLTALLLATTAAPPAPVEEFLIPSARAGNSELFLIDPVTGDAKNVTQSDQADELYPAWSPDGKRIAFTAKTRDHDFEVYTANADGSNRQRLTTSDGSGGCLAPSWSADGKQITYMRLVSGTKGEVRIVGADGKNDRLLVEGLEPCWSPDGSVIAHVKKTPGKPMSLCTITPDGATTKVLCDDLGSDAPSFPVWSPDGKQIALSVGTEFGFQIGLVSAAGGPVRLVTHLPGFNVNPVWLAADRLLFAHVVQPGQANGGYASIKTDGTRLAIHALAKAEPPHLLGRPAFYLPREEKPAESHVKPASFVEPASTKSPMIKAAPVALMPPGAPGAVVGATWAADGKRLALAFEAGFVVLGEYEGNSLKPVDAFRGHEGAVTGSAISTDGKLIYSIGTDKTVRIWDVAMKGSKAIETDETALESIALSASGKRLATGDRDGKVKVRDAATAKSEREITVCDAKRGSVHSLAFGKDDAVLFAGCAKWGMPVLNGCVAAYDPATGAELWRTKGTLGGVFSLAVSPDGTKLAGACLDTFVRIWDAKTGKELACWKGHGDRVTGIAWALGGKAVVTGSFDHTVRVWDAATGANLHTLAAHASPVIRVAVSADGKQVLSTGQIGVVVVWKLDEANFAQK